MFDITEFNVRHSALRLLYFPFTVLIILLRRLLPQ